MGGENRFKKKSFLVLRVYLGHGEKRTASFAPVKRRREQGGGVTVKKKGGKWVTLN